MARSDDFITVVSDLVRRIDRLERLGATRWGNVPDDVTPTVRQAYTHGAKSVTFSGGIGNCAFDTPLPNTCEGVVWIFAGSVGAGSLAVSGWATLSRTGFAAVCNSASFAGALNICYWAWGT